MKHYQLESLPKTRTSYLERRISLLVAKNTHMNGFRQPKNLRLIYHCTLMIQDILVVTPYNVQVNYLRSILPDNAKVGTVDKFQGQEAPIVLISMVTSSAEDLPRNIEFLYSKNRLNVAVSRAQCLAVVVANPKLLEIPCGTVEQMKLVNTFCWLDEYAQAYV